MLKQYRESLIESKELAQIRLCLYAENTLSYALLKLQIAWLGLVVKCLGGKEDE